MLISVQSFCQNIFTENGNEASKKNEIVAEVGNIKITAEEFSYNYEFGPAFPKREKDSKLTHLNYLINEKLLALAGYDEKIIEKESVNDIFNDVKSDLATEEMFQKEVVPQVNINDSEIEKVIKTKQDEYQIRWLYAEDMLTLEKYLSLLKNNVGFDSLFSSQLKDSVHIDDRQLKSSLFNIYQKNPQFAQIVDTLKPGSISDPIHTDDGWYIIKIDNILTNMVTSETEYEKLKYESEQAITKSKLDILSNQFINKLFTGEEPIIKQDVFNILKSYLGKFILSPEVYTNWDLDKKLDLALDNLGLKRGEKYPGLVLVEGKNLDISLDDFIIWYRNRENYIKLLNNDLETFSKSLEKFVWLMVRDKLLIYQANQKGYNKSDWVNKQAGWWKDKIAYSAYKNELANSIILNSEELRLISENKKSQSEIMGDELSKKILHKIIELKKKYNITINHKVLDDIKVSSENDRRAIDMYIVKRGNLFPRPAFPAIDNDWAAWE